jgi:hypothetical protein
LQPYLKKRITDGLKGAQPGPIAERGAPARTAAPVREAAPSADTHLNAARNNTIVVTAAGRAAAAGNDSRAAEEALGRDAETTGNVTAAQRDAPARGGAAEETYGPDTRSPGQVELIYPEN